MRSLVGNVAEGFKRTRAAHPIRGPVHPRQLRPRPHAGEHHAPRRVVPVHHDVPHRTVAHEGQGDAPRSALLQEVHALLRGPPADVGHDGARWVAGGELVTHRGHLRVGQRVRRGHDAGHRERPVVVLYAPDASRFHQPLERRRRRDRGVRQRGRRRLQDGGRPRRHVDAVELGDVGVNGVHQGRARARAHHRDGHVRKQIRHHDARHHRVPPVEPAPYLVTETHARGVRQSGREVGQVVPRNGAIGILGVHRPQLHGPALVRQLAGIFVPPRRYASRAVDVGDGGHHEQQRALVGDAARGGCQTIVGVGICRTARPTRPRSRRHRTAMRPKTSVEYPLPSRLRWNIPLRGDGPKSRRSVGQKKFLRLCKWC